MLPRRQQPVTVVNNWRWLKINNLINNIGAKVDILGIVIECGIPHKSKGTDYFVNLKIIDDGGNTKELTVNAFQHNIKNLPCLRGRFDVIILHNVKVVMHNNAPAVVFHRSASSFALFDGRDTVDCEPYQVSIGFHGYQSARNLVHNLRVWSSTQTLDFGISPQVTTLASIGGSLFIDLVCKVLYVHEVSVGKWMLFVWDGTDAPPLSLTNQLTNEEVSMPLHIESLTLPTQVLSNFPHIGTVLRIQVDERFEDFNVYFHHNQSWIMLRNLTCKATQLGLWKGIFTLETKLRPLSEEDESVKKCIRNYKERIQEKGCAPSTSFPRSNILTGNEQTSYSTLMDILCSTLLHCAFKCVVRVVAVFPSEPKDFRSQL